jgi:membrane associated rhomboid family serine protease/Flp pilus assembly protein TadD
MQWKRALLDESGEKMNKLESNSAQSAAKTTLLQKAPVTAALFAVNMIVFIMLVCFTSARSILIPTEQTLIDWSANYGPLTLGGEPWRIVSNTFLHASIFHLAVNLYVLFNLGPYAENLLGSRRMFALYMIAGVTGSLSSLLWNPFQVSAGASGALFGLFGCYVEESILGSGFTKKEIFKPARVMLMVAVVLSCVYGAFMPGIDNAAHLGGFLAGALLSHYFRQDLKKLWNKRDSVAVGLALTALILAESGLYFSVRNNPQYLSRLEFQNAVPLMKEKKYKEALPYLNASLKHYKNVNTFLERASAYSHLDELDKAIEDCNSAIEIEPTNRNCFIERAHVYHTMHKENLAIADLDKAIELDPKSALAYNNRAWSYASMGQYEKAIEDCNKALALKPDLPLALDTRGLSYHLLGDATRAMEDLNKAARISDKEGAAHYHRALVHESQGKTKEAAADRAESRRRQYEPEDWETNLNAEGAQH